MKTEKDLLNIKWKITMSTMANITSKTIIMLKTIVHDVLWVDNDELINVIM